MDWTTAYINDSDTAAIFTHLCHQAKASLSESKLSKIYPEYRSNLKNKRIKILRDKPVLIKLILKNSL